MIFIQEFPRTSSLQQGFPLLHSALKKRKFCSKQSIHYFVLLSQLQHLDLCIGQFWMLGLLCTRKPSRDQVTTTNCSAQVLNFLQKVKSQWVKTSSKSQPSSQGCPLYHVSSIQVTRVRIILGMLWIKFPTLLSRLLNLRRKRGSSRHSWHERRHVVVQLFWEDYKRLSCKCNCKEARNNFWKWRGLCC